LKKSTSTRSTLDIQANPATTVLKNAPPPDIADDELKHVRMEEDNRTEL
jgi:hypothetical protein